MQDSRDLPAGVLGAIQWPLPILCVTLQHYHEDLFHHFDCRPHLLDAIQGSVLHDLRLSWWPVPSLGAFTRGTCPNRHPQYRMEALDIHVELLPLAWGHRIHSLDRDASQDARHWEPHKSLRRLPWTLSLLLHLELVSRVLGLLFKDRKNFKKRARNLKDMSIYVCAGSIATRSRVSSATLRHWQLCCRQPST